MYYANFIALLSCNWPKYCRIYQFHTCLFVTILNQKFRTFLSIKITTWRHLPKTRRRKNFDEYHIFGTISYQTKISKKILQESLFSLDIHSSCFNNFNSIPSFSFVIVMLFIAFFLLLWCTLLLFIVYS